MSSSSNIKDQGCQNSLVRSSGATANFGGRTSHKVNDTADVTRRKISERDEHTDEDDALKVLDEGDYEMDENVSERVGGNRQLVGMVERSSNMIAVTRQRKNTFGMGSLTNKRDLDETKVQ